VQLRLNRSRARLLLLILSPLVFLSRLVGLFAGRGWKRSGRIDPRFLSTVQSDPLDSTGPLPVIAAFWSDGASVWKAAGLPMMARLQSEFAGRCEFWYVEAAADTQPVLDRHQVTIIPTIILFARDKEVARFVNALSDDDLRRALAGLLMEPKA
jgi:hypothetical protein